MAIQRINLGTAPSGTGGDTNRTAFGKLDANFADWNNASSRLVGTAAGNVMEVGAFGLGRGGNNSFNKSAPVSGFYTITNTLDFDSIYSAGIVCNYTVSDGFLIGVKSYQWDESGRDLYFKNYVNGAWGVNYKIYSTKNTQRDPNGFIKAASPIVSLYADKIELNDEAKLQPITFEKLGVGDYLVKGSTGFAQEGWYIEMPKDANGNVLVAVVYEQLANNDISVKTYDYMLNKKGRIVPDLETPLDIPSTRWIDLRLQALPQTNPQPFNTDETVATDAE